MISIVLLIKIIGVICFAVVWLCMYRTIRRTVRRLEYLRAHCDARLDALAQYTGLTEGGGAPEAALYGGHRQHPQFQPYICTSRCIYCTSRCIYAGEGDAGGHGGCQ